MYTYIHVYLKCLVIHGTNGVRDVLWLKIRRKSTIIKLYLMHRFRKKKSFENQTSIDLFS